MEEVENLMTNERMSVIEERVCERTYSSRRSLSYSEIWSDEILSMFDFTLPMLWKDIFRNWYLMI